MRRAFSESVVIPEGVSCSVESGILKVTKESTSLTKSFVSPNVSLRIEGDKIIIEVKKGSRKEFNVVKSFVAHILNMFFGVDKEFVYSLEACNVHFPMALKVEKDSLVITNFLGEKTPRIAKILPNVKVDIKGAKIAVSSHDKELAAQTAANMEKATLVKKRDRRIFQDGIFIVERGGR